MPGEIIHVEVQRVEAKRIDEARIVDAPANPDMVDASTFAAQAMRFRMERVYGIRPENFVMAGIDFGNPAGDKTVKMTHRFVDGVLVIDSVEVVE